MAAFLLLLLLPAAVAVAVAAEAAAVLAALAPGLDTTAFVGLVEPALMGFTADFVGLVSFACVLPAFVDLAEMLLLAAPFAGGGVSVLRLLGTSPLPLPAEGTIVF